MPPHNQRVSIEEITRAYRENGSVWKTAKALGVCGQSVWERLKSIDYPMNGRRWTNEEYEELATLAATCTISQIAARLGRPYYAVAIKISRRGLAKQFGNRGPKKLPRGAGFDKKRVGELIKLIRLFDGSLAKFCKMHSIELNTLVNAIQVHDREFWQEYSKSRTDLESAICPYCDAVYYPMTKKQKMCSRICSNAAKRDEQYFGGNRRKAIGLADGVCQLCLQKKERGLSAHHVLGKQHDPDNECLVALCQGCHQIVGHLAGRKFVDNAEGWENLIQLVMGRRMADKGTMYAGAYACVEMEYLTDADMFSEE